MRLRFDFRDGQIAEANSTTNVLVSNNFAEFPDVDDPDHIHLILDPVKEYGDPEMVYIVEHVAGSTTAIVHRAQDGTTARLHPADTLWVHGVVASDFEDITGPEGPQGPPGPAFSYVHDQGAPKAIWTINHNLNGYPNVTVIDSTDSVVEGNVVYEGPNTIRVEFAGGFSGKAYLS